MKKDIGYYLSTEEGQEQKEKTINEVLDHMDFGMIHRVMECLDWTWIMEDEENGGLKVSVPTETEIRKSLEGLLRTLFDEECEMVSTGGFTVEYTIKEPLPSEPDDFEHCVSVRAFFAVDKYETY